MRVPLQPCSRICELQGGKRTNGAPVIRAKGVRWVSGERLVSAATVPLIGAVNTERARRLQRSPDAICNTQLRSQSCPRQARHLFEGGRPRPRLRGLPAAPKEMPNHGAKAHRAQHERDERHTATSNKSQPAEPALPPALHTALLGLAMCWKRRAHRRCQWWHSDARRK